MTAAKPKPATMSRITLKRGYVRKHLARNLARRRKAAAEYAAARDELLELLEAGVKAELHVTELSGLAGIPRRQAHRILNGPPRFITVMDTELGGNDE